jgi:hypothetical protein
MPAATKNFFIRSTSDKRDLNHSYFCALDEKLSDCQPASAPRSLQLHPGEKGLFNE